MTNKKFNKNTGKTANINPHYTSAIKKLLPPTAGCFSTVAQARGIKLDELPRRLEPQTILMCDPQQFRIIDVKNAFMEGNINRTSTNKAVQQWNSVRSVFDRLGYHVEVVRSRAEREDMVFTANQVLLGADEGRHGSANSVRHNLVYKFAGKYVVLANMVHPSRRKEIPYFEKWFAAHGYRIIKLHGQRNIGISGSEFTDAGITAKKNRPSPYFEGQGDALWHPGVQLLWGGWGHRTELAAHQQLCELINVPIVTLHLVHPKFYHLDTAFCPLDMHAVMYYPKAFDIHGNELIRHFFKNVIVVNDADAENFACNALPLGKNVILQKGSNRVCAHLRQHGFKPIEVDTSEFMKSGGSVSCLKMLIY